MLSDKIHKQPGSSVDPDQEPDRVLIMELDRRYQALCDHCKRTAAAAAAPGTKPQTLRPGRREPRR